MSFRNLKQKLQQKIQHEIAEVTRISKQRYSHKDAPRIEALEWVLKLMREMEKVEK